MFVNTVATVKRLVDPDAILLQGAADPTRLSILRQLAGSEGVCACDFTACCDVAQPTVSHHLKVLREAGWVRSERRASYVYYWLRPEAVERFRSIAGEFAAGDSARHPVADPGRTRDRRIQLALGTYAVLVFAVLWVGFALGLIAGGQVSPMPGHG